MNQKGFIQVTLLIAALILAGVLGGQNVVSQVSKSFPSDIKLPIITDKQEKVPSSESSKSIIQSQTTVISQSDDKNIKVAGKYNLAADKKIEYEFTLPKNGGPINGKLGGMCEGEITGNAEKPNEEGKAKVQGVLGGNCQMAPLPFKTTLAASFEGTADYQSNNINLAYKVTKPISTQSNLVIPFLQPKTSEELKTSSYEVTVNPLQVDISGVYKISDSGLVKYNISVPRQTGTITGSTSGDCGGTISGQIGEEGVSGTRQINGAIQVTCKPIVPLGGRTNIGGTFWGSLNDKKGEIEVIHNGIFQTDANGYFVINYSPKD